MNDTSPLGFRRGHGRVSQAFPMSLVTSPYIPPFGSTTALLPCLRSSAQTPNFEISLSTVYSHTQTIPFLRGILWQLQRGHTWLHFVVYWLLLAVVDGQSFLPLRRERRTLNSPPSLLPNVFRTNRKRNDKYFKAGMQALQQPSLTNVLMLLQISSTSALRWFIRKENSSLSASVEQDGLPVGALLHLFLVLAKLQLAFISNKSWWNRRGSLPVLWDRKLLFFFKNCFIFLCVWVYNR